MMHVYFLEAVGCSPAVVKIGVSSFVLARISSLQTGMPFKLRLIGYVTYPTDTAARSAESKLHKKFKAKRLEGEWFELTPKIRASIMAMVGNSASIPLPTIKLPEFPTEPNYQAMVPPASSRGKDGRFQSKVPSI